MTIDTLFPKPIKKPAQPPGGQTFQNIVQEANKNIANNLPQPQMVNSNSQSLSQTTSITSSEALSAREPKEVTFPVEGYKDDELMWEFLASLQVIKSPVKKTNLASKK